MASRRSSAITVVFLVLLWIGAFVLCYWLVGTNHYVGPVRPLRIAFSFTLSALIFLAACKVLKLEGIEPNAASVSANRSARGRDWIIAWLLAAGLVVVVSFYAFIFFFRLF